MKRGVTIDRVKRSVEISPNYAILLVDKRISILEDDLCSVLSGRVEKMVNKRPSQTDSSFKP